MRAGWAFTLSYIEDLGSLKQLRIQGGDLLIPVLIVVQVVSLDHRYLPRISGVGGGKGFVRQGILALLQFRGEVHPGVDGVPVAGGEEQQIGLTLLHGG